jgi:hypothetical protein
MNISREAVAELLVALGYPTVQLSQPRIPHLPDKPDSEQVKLKRRALAKALLDFRKE